MGQTSRFREHVHPIVDYVVRGLVIRFFTNLGKTRGWKNARMSAWSRNFN